MAFGCFFWLGVSDPRSHGNSVPGRGAGDMFGGTSDGVWLWGMEMGLKLDSGEAFGYTDDDRCANGRLRAKRDPNHLLHMTGKRWDSVFLSL